MRNTSNKGFTLIELLIVIAIIGILAAVLVPQLLNARNRANDTAASAYARQVITWIASADTGTTTAAEQAALEAVGTCDHALLQAEGATATFPKSVSACGVGHDGTRFLVTVTGVVAGSPDFTFAY